MTTSDLANATFRKASYSNGAGNDCVEVCRTPDAAAFQDSKDRSAGYFAVPLTSWNAFAEILKSGQVIH